MKHSTLGKYVDVVAVLAGGICLLDSDDMEQRSNARRPAGLYSPACSKSGNSPPAIMCLAQYDERQSATHQAIMNYTATKQENHTHDFRAFDAAALAYCANNLVDQYVAFVALYIALRSRVEHTNPTRNCVRCTFVHSVFSWLLVYGTLLYYGNSINDLHPYTHSDRRHVARLHASAIEVSSKSTRTAPTTQYSNICACFVRELR